MQHSLSESVEMIAAAGYDGVEGAVEELADRSRFRTMLTDARLAFIPLIYTEGHDPAEHLKNFSRLVAMAAEFVPTKIVAHAGRDLWSLDEQLRFLEAALRVEEAIGIPIAHETHRRRPLYSPMNARAILERLPELKLNADLSHWCCVTESMLDDHSDTIAFAATRTIHIHCRVGYENGPQVSDPRATEWGGHLAKFESWWAQMIREQGDEKITVTPEFGPPSYMHTVPGTNQPVADLWEVCLWAARRFRTMARL
ncbi:MAG: sugar phosphate isomerase/epimerase [Bacteroidetes bacterium]|nr:sugar phosphate isomerase/epimerase [Bacteroidota bacterium]